MLPKSNNKLILKQVNNYTIETLKKPYPNLDKVLCIETMLNYFNINRKSYKDPCTRDIQLLSMGHFITR